MTKKDKLWRLKDPIRKRPVTQVDVTDAAKQMKRLLDISSRTVPPKYPYDKHFLEDQKTTRSS